MPQTIRRRRRTSSPHGPGELREVEEGARLGRNLPREPFQLQCENDTLTLEGDLSLALDPSNSTQAVQAELPYPRFRRSFVVGNELDTQSIQAEMKDGVLKIQIPRRASAKPQKILIS